MIDWASPVRTARSKRRLYVVGWTDRGPQLDAEPDARSGVPYLRNGEPQGAIPWGAVENFDPAEGLFDGWHDVPSPAARRFEREQRETHEDNPLFGLF